MALLKRFAILLKKPRTAAPDESTLLLAQAEAFEASQNWDAALQCYARATENAPALAVAHFRRGNILLDQGDYQQAVGAYATALHHKPDSAGAQFNMGVAQQGLGNDVEAEQRYQKAVELNPQLWDAWIALGELQASKGQWEKVANSFSKALTGLPDDPVVCFKHALALHNLQQFALAETRFKKVLMLNPKHVDALYSLGAIALKGDNWKGANVYFEGALALKEDHLKSLSGLGAYQLQDSSFKAAEAIFRQTLALHPRSIDAHIGLCVALRELKQLDESLACIDNATNLEPENATACIEQGLTLHALGKYASAEDWYRKALRLNPADANIYNNLGAIKCKLGETESAITFFRRAVEMEADFAQAHLNLGTSLQALGRYPEATLGYDQALTLEPEFAEAHLAKGSLLQLLGNLVAAEHHYRRAITIKPDLVVAYSNLGTVLGATRRYDEALRCYDKAREVNSKSADVLVNQSNLLKDTGRVAESIEVLRHALELDPLCMAAHHNLLFNQNYMAQRSAALMLADAVQFGKVASVMAKAFDRWEVTPEPRRKLRLGFVSGDLLDHPVGYFLEGVLGALHAFLKDSIEVVCYPTRICADALSQRLKAHAAEWVHAYGMSDETLAQRIRNDRIDILFDLSGHTRHNRLPMFAWKPAPVQVSWIGYFATTGLPAIDYFLADSWTMPDEEEAYFTEKVWRLPETRLCFTPPEYDIPVGTLPAIANGFVTFACFNNLAKINDVVLDVWAQILERLPSSKFFIKSQLIGEESSRNTVVGWFTSRGIAEERLILEDYGARQDYLAAHHRTDIALDPFPFPGGTTTAESLWMGVPVITLQGEHFLSRQGVGLLVNAGLTDWIAQTTSDYIERAVRHASDVEELKILRHQLRGQVADSPIFDAPRFALNFEAAIRGMWTQWCEAATSIVYNKPEPAAKVVTIVCATRMKEDEFWKHAALGRSVKPLLNDLRIRLQIAFENRIGLPELYNHHIQQCKDNGVLVFVHDDVWLDDCQWVDKTLNGLQTFDVIGLAGNTRIVPRQPGWSYESFLDGKFEWDTAHLSGEISHGHDAFGKPMVYGPTRTACELLDGVFLAANVAMLKERHVAFDTRFSFHFYDLDFCRTARKQGLKLGTWPIAVTHQSGGAFGSPTWLEGYEKYLSKWGD